MQTKYFRLAERMAWKSDHRIKIGSVLVHKGQILNVGHNKVGKSHPKYPWFLHAELDCCLGQGLRDLSGSSVYLFRINTLGIAGHCKPCDVCVRILKELRVKSVCYMTGRVALIEFPWQEALPEYAEVVL